MNMRQIALDTETTGLRVEEGHRIIEVGCVELIDRKLTGNNFHQYINPGRDIEAAALAVHGISTEFLRDKPAFDKIARELFDYLDGAELIIHNAAFDLGFLNFEFKLTRGGYKTLQEYCSIIDTLQVARKQHAGQRNSLDALCKRYAIDNSKRELHGALMDASLLAQVYLGLTGGQGSFFDESDKGSQDRSKMGDTKIKAVKSGSSVIIKANANELEQHNAYLEFMEKNGSCLWLTEKSDNFTQVMDDTKK